MEEKHLTTVMHLLCHPYSTGKEIAQKTYLSESDVSKYLNTLKKEGVVDNKPCQPQKGKNYTGKCWFIVDEIKTVHRMSELIVAQQQKIISQIKTLMEQHNELENRGTESRKNGFFTLHDILFAVCPPNIDPRKMCAAIGDHDVIFELERIYYETKIAPYNQAIESAKTDEERDKSIKLKEEMESHIFKYVLTPRSCLEKETFEDYTEKEGEWVVFRCNKALGTPPLFD